MTGLVCAKCGAVYPPETRNLLCPNRDDGRLDIHYDYEKIRERITRQELERRKGGVWKYLELLPVREEANIITLGEGGTPLIRASRLGKSLGLTNLLIKDDTRNPTWSFKDRPITVGVSKAVELGYKTVVSASSGNAAAALAAFSAKAGLRCYTFVPETASPGKIAQLLMYGATVVRLSGLETGEDPTVKMLREVVDRYGWYPCPSFGPFNPYQAEGPKTLSYEILEQLDWQVPDWVLAGVGAGGLIGGNWKGFKEFEAMGLVEETPRLVAVQSEGCAPVVRAYETGKASFEIEPWERPESVATGLMDPLPWDGDAALKAIRESSGTAMTVSDAEILEGQRLLVRDEGIFAEPSGVAALAGLMKLLREEKVGRQDRVVVEITGSGLKDPEIALKGLREPSLIKPRMDELERELGAG